MDNNIELYIELLKKVLTASIYDESAWSIKSKAAIRPGKPISNIGRRFRNLLIDLFRKQSLLLVKVKPFDAKVRDEGIDRPIIGFTMVGRKRLDNVQACIEDVLKNNIPGDFIETGAWRGGTTIFMRALLKIHGVTDRVVWVADSFEGMPVPKNVQDGDDLSHLDSLSVSLETVKSKFEKFDMLDDQVRFLNGWFCDNLHYAPIDEIAILRLDGDLYHSTMDSLTNLYHKVSKGGYVIIDDYYSWPECGRAVTDFLQQENLKPKLIDIDSSAVYWQCG